MRPTRSASSPAARLVSAFAAPKATTKARIAAVEREPEVLLADQRQHAALEADHRADERVERDEQRELAAFARRPSRTSRSCGRGDRAASGWRRRSPPARRAAAACRRAAPRRTRRRRRARAAGCARARSRSRRTGCRRGRGRRPSRRSGSDRGRRRRAARAGASQASVQERAPGRCASPATCRSGRPTSPISSESPLNTSHGSRRAAPPVGDRVGVMGGRVARRRDRGHERVPELDHLAVGERDVLELDAGVRRAGRRSRRCARPAPAARRRGRPGRASRRPRRSARRSQRRPRGSRRRGRRAGRRRRACAAWCSRTGSWHRSWRRSGTVEAASGLLSARRSRPAARPVATRESRRRAGAPSARGRAAAARRRRRRRSTGRGSRRRSPPPPAGARRRSGELVDGAERAPAMWPARYSRSGARRARTTPPVASRASSSSGRELLDPVALAQIVVGEHLDLGHVLGPRRRAPPPTAHRRARSRAGSRHASPLDGDRTSPACASTCRCCEVFATLWPISRGELVDRALALREHVDDLGPPAVAERLRHRRECAEELVLGLTSLHVVTISSERLNVKVAFGPEG